MTSTRVPLLSDTKVKWKTPIPRDTYHQYCKNVYSQNGEDGIIEQLIAELDIKEGFFCEFGASDGVTCSNTYNLIKNLNYSGIAIEGDKSRYDLCVKNYKLYPNVKVYHGMVVPFSSNKDQPQYNLDKWLSIGDAPKDLDILSIDIDGDDYYVWDEMVEFSPKIVIFEVNSYRDPVFDELPNQPSTEYNIDLLKMQIPQRVAFGCSFMSAIKLGLKKGYIPLAFTGNLTFIRKDLVKYLTHFPYKLSDNPYDYIYLYSNLSLWDDQWYTNSGLTINWAIGNYYLYTQKKEINIEWLNALLDNSKKA